MQVTQRSPPSLGNAVASLGHWGIRAMPAVFSLPSQFILVADAKNLLSSLELVLQISNQIDMVWRRGNAAVASSAAASPTKEGKDCQPC
ncbi:MAG: hypothetical protein V7K48_27410 [Nostoc sp.]|uniref:hypothetical protein n=1 Tax=Nostoc sp. TaxID=1180 RepID=UPI002FF93096